MGRCFITSPVAAIATLWRCGKVLAIEMNAVAYTIQNDRGFVNSAFIFLFLFIY
jgi:hypothetical protein